MRPIEFWDMAPNDFNALCEGYENKKHAEQDFFRAHAYQIVSPYLKQGTGYDRFKRNWRFGWEEDNTVEFKPLTHEEIEAIKQRHQKYLKPKKI